MPAANDRTQGSGLATAATALGLALAAGAAVALHLDAAPPERRWDAVSFPLVWATPALLGLLGRRRPVLLVPAALLATVLAFFSLSGVTLLLLLPAGLWAAAQHRRRPPWPGPVRSALLVALPLGGLAAFSALLASQDPVCWDLVRRPDGSEDHRVRPAADCSGVMVATAGPVVGGGSTSDTVVAGEALVSGLLVTGTLVVGWVAAAPRGEP